MSVLPPTTDIVSQTGHVRFVPIVLQKSFCGMGLKFSEAWARRLNNDVGDHVATRQTHRRFWQRVCGSIERRLSLVSFFGGNLAAAAFGTFATLSARSRMRLVSSNKSAHTNIVEGMAGPRGPA